MKQLLIIAFALLVLGAGMINAVFADSSDTWNIKVVTGPETRTIVPLNSTGMLGLENFTVSTVGQVSSLAFNTSISELTFQADMSPYDASVSGTNTNVTLPVSIVANSTLVLNVNVDGKGNGYMLFEPSTLGFYLYEGSHMVTVDIGIVDPSSLPEFPTSSILLLLPLLVLAIVAILEGRNKANLDD
jgi:hypothetical protein